MATWNQLRQTILATYGAEEISPQALRLLFEMDGGRSQLVFITSVVGKDGSEWASIDSPVGAVGEVNVSACLLAVSGLVCGGLAQVDLGDVKVVTIRHSVPLANLDPNEFQEPLSAVTQSADDFERVLTDGGDRF